MTLINLNRKLMKSFLWLLPCLLGFSSLYSQNDLASYYALVDSINSWQEEHILYQQAPQFKANLMKGEDFDLADQKGKIVFINFWFTSCRPCIEELPDLEALHEKYANQEVSFVSICLDRPEDIERLFSRIRKDQSTYQIPTITDGDEIVKKYGVALFPTNMLVDQAGVIQFIGNSNLKQIERKLKKMLKS